MNRHRRGFIKGFLLAGAIGFGWVTLAATQQGRIIITGEMFENPGKCIDFNDGNCPHYEAKES